MNKTFIAAALALAALTQPAWAELKIGFVNTDRVFREAAPAQRALKALEKEFAPRAQELQALAKQIRDMQTDLDKNGMTMKDSDRRNKEREIEALNRDFQRRNREFREDQNMRSGQEMASIQERANKVIQQIADAEKYDLILQEAVFVSPRIDITDKVLKSLSDK
ncbi:MAG: OmpH family outer membrane protein [Chitinivorax sp.]